MIDDDLCAATYPGPADRGQLCDRRAGHDDHHRALTEIAGRYRRHHVWTQDGQVLPDLETTKDFPAATGTGEQTSPSKGDQVT